MFKRYGILTALALVIILVCISCTDNNQTERSDLSVDGAVIETGLEVDDDYRIKTQETVFTANQDFYFSFDNNQPFGSDRLTVQLIDGRNDKVLAEHTYEVDPGDHSLTDVIFFGNPGKFFITVRINGLVRATREVTIE